MTTEKFFEAADYIPLIVTSWIIFGMRYHFETGILIEKKTKYFAYINGFTAIFGIALNFLLIGQYKIWGALLALNINQLVTTGLFYRISQRLYAVRYDFRFIMKLAVLGLSFYAAASLVEHGNIAISLALKSVVIALYLVSLRLLGLFDDTLLAQIKQICRRVAAIVSVRQAPAN
jgi:O-antigen/teichoic acid export membrane protein